MNAKTIKQVMQEMGRRGGKKNSKEHMKAASLLAVAARKKKREEAKRVDHVALAKNIQKELGV